MKIKTWVVGSAAVAGAAALGLSAPGAAQAQRYSSPPPGSYWQTCQKVRVTDSGRLTLWAECRDFRGRYVISSLDYEDCRGEITNENGRLSCFRGPSGGYGDRGAYGDRSGYDDRSGSYGSGAWGSNPGGDYNGGYNNGGYNRGNDGDYQRPRARGGSITLYQGLNFTGVAFATSTEITNLPKQNNDRTLSIKVGRGAWEICTDKDFGGRCQIIDRDVPDLNRVSMAYAITSLRQVR